MEVVYFLLPLALLLVVAGVLAFWWACHDGQFDDMKTPAMRILFDDPESELTPKPTKGETKR